MRKEELLEHYMWGFDDELNSENNRDSIIGNLYKKAYSMGSMDALVGDELSSSDNQTEDEILRKILGISEIDSIDLSLYIYNTKEEWNPKTQKSSGYGYHGSSKGDKIEFTEYFDEYRIEWTNKDRAFQGFLFKKINELYRKTNE